jgi:DNA-binding NarL/FixJ family response regulator
MRIVIADDHELMRRGIRSLIDNMHTEWTVVGEAARGDEAVRLVTELQPDVAILDFAMPGRSGPDAARAYAALAPSTRTIVLTMHDCDETLREVVQCGAHGYVLKGDADTQLMLALHAIAEGRRFFHASAEEALRLGFLQRMEAQDRQERACVMTQRESEIITLLAMGFSSKEVAVKLNIGTRTVETHRLNIYRKLQLRTIADLVRYAIRTGIVSPN